MRDRLLSELRPSDLCVAWAFDRLTRQGMEDAGRLLRLIEEAGARLVTVTDGVDTKQDYGDLNVGVKAILAREESRKKETSVRSAKALARNEDRWLDGKAPYGTRVVEGRITPDPETAAIARRIADEALDGLSIEWASLTGQGRAREPLGASQRRSGGFVFPEAVRRSERPERALWAIACQERRYGLACLAMQVFGTVVYVLCLTVWTLMAFIALVFIGGLVLRPQCVNEIRNDASDYCDHVDLGFATVKTPEIISTITGQKH